MLTSKKVINAINEQIGYEFSASMQYYAIAAHFAAEALPQLSAHFFQQAEEEKDHALRFIKYVVDAGGSVVIPAIDAPQSKFKNPEQAVKLSLDQEVKVTHQINALVELARSENDYITINFLQWFLTEQLEEVSSMDNLLKIVQRAGDDLLQADEYLARVGVRTMPAAKGEYPRRKPRKLQIPSSKLQEKHQAPTFKYLGITFRNRRRSTRSFDRDIRSSCFGGWDRLHRPKS
jgi:ferritin